ncbi:MAG: phosphoglucomutase/phosphomannomutase family protein, partial [Bellilinea sp.]
MDKIVTILTCISEEEHSMTTKIKFGTDGWRGFIGEDYTFANVRRCAQGFASYLLDKGKQGQWVVIGYDKRFLSENFALATAEVLCGNGFKVYLTQDATPTPVIAFSVVNKGAAGAINITASHNPPTDNGFKVRDERGGAVNPEGLKQIESLIPDSENEVKLVSAEETEKIGALVRFDPAPAYIEHLKS